MDKLETQTFPALFFIRDAAQTCRLEFSVIFFSILFFPYLLLFAALGVTNTTKASRNGKINGAVKDRGGRMARGLETRCVLSQVCFFSFFLLNIANGILLTDSHHLHLNAQPRKLQGTRCVLCGKYF
jgi:hypothetical protein